MVQEVQALNKRIEAINVQKTRAEAKTEMLKKQLVSAIDAYEKTYGVVLKDKSFAKLSGKVKAELGKVSGALQSEYDLKEKVVTAIENQQYEAAYRLLGVEPEAEETAEEIEGSTEDVAEVGINFEEDTEEVNGTPLDVDDNAVEDDMDFGDIALDVEDEEVEEEPVKESKPKGKVKGESAVEAAESMDMSVEEDDELPNVDMDFGFGDMLSGTKFEV